MSGDQAPDLINCLNLLQPKAVRTKPSIPGRLKLSSAALNTSPPSHHAVLDSVSCPHCLPSPKQAFEATLNRSDGQLDTT